MWAYSSLAGNCRAHECKADFFAFVDMYYVQSEDARNRISDEDRRRIHEGAQALHKKLYPAISDVLSECRRDVERLDESAVEKHACRVLILINNLLLDHALPSHRRNLIAKCVLLGGSYEALQVGQCTSVELAYVKKELVETGGILANHVFERIKKGDLVVENGRTVKKMVADST